MEVPLCALLIPGQGCVLDEGVLEQRCSDEMRIMVFHGSLLVAAQLRMSLRAAGMATLGLLSEGKGCPELSPSLSQRSPCDGRKGRFCSMKISLFHHCFLLWKKNDSSRSRHLLLFKGSSSSPLQPSWGLKVYKTLFFPNL